MPKKEIKWNRLSDLKEVLNMNEIIPYAGSFLLANVGLMGVSLLLSLRRPSLLQVAGLAL